MRWLLIALAGFWVPGLALAQSLPVSSPTSTPAPAEARCSDGFVSAGEECDDGNILNGDGCSISCRIERCGDGNLQADKGETCDDGNNASFDGCSSSCTAEKTYRSRKVGLLISAGTSLIGIPIANFTGSAIPMMVSFGIGPTLGRLYVKDYPQAATYTALRGGMLGIMGLGFLLAQRSFRAENIGNGIPLDAFPGDGSFLLAGTLVVGGIAAFATVALIDIVAVRVGPQTLFSQRPLLPSLQLAPLISTGSQSTFGLTVGARF